MIVLNPHLALVVIAAFYILVFGGLSLLRREGLSNQFAFEVIGLTGIIVLVSQVVPVILNPVLFLIFVHVVSMRSRLLVDIANRFFARGDYSKARSLYELALRLRPDATTRLIVLTNYGAMRVREGHPEEAIAVLQGVLANQSRHRLGTKYEAACRYNLGLAYRRTGKEAQAVREFNHVIEVMPGSLYAVGARTALKKRGED